MSKLVVLSEINCLGYLRAHGLCPDEFYTDIELFRTRSMFFNDVIVMVLYAGSCIFSKRKVEDLTKTLHERAISDDAGVADLIIVSDSVLPHCKDYFLYQNNPLNCVRYSGWKPTSGLFNLTNLDYDKSEVTKTYLVDSDYGINEDALKAVRNVDQSEQDLIALIKVPSFT